MGLIRDDAVEMINDVPRTLLLVTFPLKTLSLPKNGLHCEACCGGESYGSDWISWAGFCCVQHHSVQALSHSRLKVQPPTKRAMSVAVEPTAPTAPTAPTVPIEPHLDVKLFNRWSFDDVQVSDISLADYVGVAPAKHATYVPHTAGRYSVKRFRKAQCPIVERLTNSLMMHGRNNGKKLMAVRIIRHAMEIIHLLTDQNPIQIIVDAVVNSGPREDATRIGSAGVVRRQAVDISPLRRVNQAIYLLTTGARESAFRNIKTIAECLADELINAAKGSSNSYAIKKKDEIERVAKANR
ncbi:40S ribosomal protein S5 [Prunus yedoensis var. nudiflora]|uniref:40S ribosomal protein S5 n=1 Tax=Prunus yedoensis var. nudiflora TaxID=2094558 RepID=A0A314ZWJ5_PRUYE|nr:40S ribosomal protein S5 [Prunus yedoensis var. nudiflora]